MTAASALAAGLAKAEPQKEKNGLKMRSFPKSGKQVTEFCIGGHHVGKGSEKNAEALIETAIEEGVTFFDTARIYQKGRAETYYGKFLTPKYRDDIFLMSKSEKVRGKDARKALETSLKLMKTDYLDLWLVHAITDKPNTEKRFNEGAVDEFVKAKEEGIVKHIGFSGHTDYRSHLHFLKLLDERGIDMDACLLPINLVDPHYDSFILNVVPELEKRKYGILAMKTLAFGRMLGAGPENIIKTRGKTESMENDGVGVKEMHEYAYSFPITSLVSGCETPKEVRENVKIAKNFNGLSGNEQERLVNIAEKYAGKTMEHYKA